MKKVTKIVLLLLVSCIGINVQAMSKEDSSPLTKQFLHSDMDTEHYLSSLNPIHLQGLGRGYALMIQKIKNFDRENGNNNAWKRLVNQVNDIKEKRNNTPGVRQISNDAKAEMAITSAITSVMDWYQIK